MGYELKRYIRKYSETRIFFEVIETKDELVFISKGSPDIVTKKQVGKAEIIELEPYRRLTDAENALVSGTSSDD